MKIEDLKKIKLSWVTALSVILFILGFLIWNFYLYTLGFTEGEILKAKFILTGLFFSLLTLIIFSIIHTIFYVLKKFKFSICLYLEKIFRKYRSNKYYKKIFNTNITFNIDKELKATIKITFFILVFFCWIYWYSINLFFIIPQSWGGGQPRSLSFIANNDQLAVLKSLNIDLGEGADNQTENLCITHENDNFVYVLREDRILAIDKKLINGFGSLPGLNKENEQFCINYARDWAKTGSKSSFILLKSQLFNLYANIVKLPIQSYVKLK